MNAGLKTGTVLELVKCLGGSKNRDPIKMDVWGVPLFSETSISVNSKFTLQCSSMFVEKLAEVASAKCHQTLRRQSGLDVRGRRRGEEWIYRVCWQVRIGSYINCYMPGFKRSGKHVFATPQKWFHFVNGHPNSVATLEVSGGGFEMFNASGDSDGADMGLEMKDAATLPRPETSEFQHLHSFLWLGRSLVRDWRTWSSKMAAFHPKNLARSEKLVLGNLTEVGIAECNYKIGNSPRFVAGIVDEGLNLQTHPRVHDKKVIFCNMIWYYLLQYYVYWYVIFWWCPTCWTVGHGFFGTSMS